MAAALPKVGALQLVTLNKEAKKVEVNEDALGRLEKNLKAVKANKVAVISVMGAFRTGKSFLLDLFLRHLRYEQKLAEAGEGPPPPTEAPERGGEEEYPLPAWMTDAGTTIEGGVDGAEDGFRFKGGMDHCTEGIWVWSEPFVRQVDGEPVALVLMDTQGAWDGNMTKEQSATIFGLTALISSKQIYNISMQIQEDKVENLAYFMTFAQAALRKAMQGCSEQQQGEIEKPFQSLDFLVRDWSNFDDSWTTAECKDQMAKHLDKHLNPERVVENGTAEALQKMFARVSCFCLPEPGKKIRNVAWTGKVTDIDRDFVRFIDDYVRDVFTVGLAPKKLLGADLSTETFPVLLRNFVRAFHDAAPAAMSFTQAMASATTLLAKEKALNTYIARMDEETAKAKQGMQPEQMASIHRSVSSDIEAEFKNVTILGDDKMRDATWQSIQKKLAELHKQYCDENDRRLEKALIAFGNMALIAAFLFVLDRASDWTCDWWSQTCRDASKLMFMVYFAICIYIGVYIYKLYADRGGLATSAASMELWKEVMRLSTVYLELGKQVKMKDVVEFSQKVLKDLKETSGKAVELASSKAGGGDGGKKNK
mmetsp:Transcript_24566/g.70082  ORF Transcript_24566/g.70082 Transcript_24566/m.70082 type:complete len:594 (+) Transcript_24566:85-1866(+)